MKTFLFALLLALAGSEVLAQTPPGLPVPGAPGASARTNLPARSLRPRLQRTVPTPTRPSPNAPGAPGTPGAGFPGAAAPGANLPPAQNFLPPQNNTPAEEMIPAGTIDFQGVDVSQVLDVYAKLVNRTIIRGALPAAQIVLKTQTPLTKTEAIEALQAVLALNNISVVNIGDKFVKAAQSDQANGLGAPLDDAGSTNLPEMGSYVTHVTQLKYILPSKMLTVLQPFGKLQGGILPIDDNGILVIRDYAENVKRMLEMIAKIDVSVPEVYTNEVIPIRYAKVDEIASALNSLGGGGGTVASIGTAPSSSHINGFSSATGGGSSFGGQGGVGGQGAYGAQGGSSSSFGGGQNRSLGGGSTANGTPSGGGSTFAQRLNNIINKASGSGQDQIQLFGQTKIIPNESSSSLLIFATRQDMEEIKTIVAKLDVPLQQVLIEAIMIDYSLGPNTLNIGTSVAQNPTSLGGTSQGAGGYNNASFLNFATQAVGSNAVNGVFGNSLGSGANYFADIGPSWSVAITAIAADSHATVIQRPRMTATQAKPAQFFVGDTVPYASGSSYGSIYGNNTSYSQLSVGVELDVTPFINPDGAVAMDIQQEIDDLNGFTTIENVGQVPNTIKRTLNTSMTVRDRDTVMLGGFIKASKSTSRTGVPFLQDIPLLGVLFSQRSDSKGREELIVLMRPTVLPTPELAAKQTLIEEQRLPEVSRAAAEENAENRKQIEQQRHKEQTEFNKTHHADGFYTREIDGTNQVTAITNEVTAPVSPSADNTLPPDATTDDAKADFQRKAMQMNAGLDITPAQTAQLNALLSRYLANEISTEEYQAESKKILASKP